MADITLNQLVYSLAEDGGPDLRGYKHATLERRMRRRMSDLSISAYSEYLDYSRKTPGEPADLLNKVLINVTEFFRDPPAWEYLRTQLLPRLLANLKPGDTFRAWAAGCSTGEEAYSVALLMADVIGEDLNQFDVKIYATDIDEEALLTARRGEYPPEKLRRVRPEMRQRYFMPVGRSLRANREIRRLLIFGRSNLVSNAPIPHCNLVVCRNLLIYFDTTTQKRILERLHYALDPGGILFLGKAESKLSESRLFRPVNSRWRFFQRLPSSGELVADSEKVAPALESGKEDQELKMMRIYQQNILEAVRAGVIALDANDIVLTHNDAAVLLWGLNSAKIAGRHLQNTKLVFRCPEIIARLESTRAGRGGAVQFQCAVKSSPNANNEERLLSVTLRPVIDDDGQRAGAVISCDDITDREKMQNMLERFEATSEELQSANQELKTTNEELQSTNEELETTNEELQSSNEELETTNEELQSLSEELENMNEELEQRTHELTALNAHYTDILQRMPWPVVLVDAQERIQLWNAAAQQWFGVGSTSVVGVDMERLPLEAATRRALVRRFRAVMASAKPSVLRSVQLRNRGELGEFDIHFAPVCRNASNTEGVLVMFGPPIRSRRPSPARVEASSKPSRNGGAPSSTRSRTHK
ncbi:MAG TPA: CheR family methyltransferase [Terriglobales bacterium]|nr:CheR family methyltransferase [Terriglobales bacterium]